MIFTQKPQWRADNTARRVYVPYLVEFVVFRREKHEKVTSGRSWLVINCEKAKRGSHPGRRRSFRGVGWNGTCNKAHVRGAESVGFHPVNQIIWLGSPVRADSFGSEKKKALFTGFFFSKLDKICDILTSDWSSLITYGWNYFMKSVYMRKNSAPVCMTRIWVRET